MKYHLTTVSRNAKTGPLPVSTSSAETCPTSCPLILNGCYAKYGPLKLHWDRVTHTGINIDSLCTDIRRLPRRQLWRYGQAGDLPGKGDVIDALAFKKLVRANARRPVICFSHKPMTPQNLALVRWAAEKGFVVNLSANDVDHATELLQYGLPVVVILPSTYARRKVGGSYVETRTAYRERRRDLPLRLPTGEKIIVCPATTEDVNCSNCGLCARPRNKNAVIGFPSHGTARGYIDSLLQTRYMEDT